jgi:RNA polymerase sigma-70 factor (ECF subfamily)
MTNAYGGANRLQTIFFYFFVTFSADLTHYVFEGTRNRSVLDPDHDLELAALLADGQKGDHAAYERFLTEASVVLRRFLIRRMKNPEIAEDVLQDALLAIHKARHTYLPGRPVGPWMYAITNHRMMDFYRWHRKVEAVEVMLAEDVHDRSDEENTRGRSIREALRGLPEKQRQVIKMLKVQGLSVKEVAVLTGMSESSVKVTAFRGYEAVRKIFGVTKK